MKTNRSNKADKSIVTGIEHENGSLKFAKDKETASDYLKTHPGAELISVAVHPTGKARIIFWEDGEWNTIGPEWDSFNEAATVINNLAKQAMELGLPSLIQMMKMVDINTFEAGESSLPVYSDKEWLKYTPDNAPQQPQKPQTNHQLTINNSDQTDPPAPVRINFKPRS